MNPVAQSIENHLAQPWLLQKERIRIKLLKEALAEIQRLEAELQRIGSFHPLQNYDNQP